MELILALLKSKIDKACDQCSFPVTLYVRNYTCFIKTCLKIHWSLNLNKNANNCGINDSGLGNMIIFNHYTFLGTNLYKILAFLLIKSTNRDLKSFKYEILILRQNNKRN